ASGGAGGRVARGPARDGRHPRGRCVGADPGARDCSGSRRKTAAPPADGAGRTASSRDTRTRARERCRAHTRRPVDPDDLSLPRGLGARAPRGVRVTLRAGNPGRGGDGPGWHRPCPPGGTARARRRPAVRVGMTTSIGIRLERVGKRYDDGATSVDALRDVDLTVSAGEFVAVVGPSGSGKSTLLHLVAGLDRPTGGQVVVGDEDLAALSEDARSDFRLRHVGVVFQTFNLFPTLTAEENVACPLRFLGIAWREARGRAAVVLEQVGIARAMHARLPAQLSGGEQQRVALARALVTEPSLVLADEPTGNLDTRTAGAILDLLARLNVEGAVTVLPVTHNPSAARYARRMIELRDGAILRDRGVRGELHVAPRSA